MAQIISILYQIILSRFAEMKSAIITIIKLKNILDFVDPEEKSPVILFGRNSGLWMLIYLTCLVSNRKLIIINPEFSIEEIIPVLRQYKNPILFRESIMNKSEYFKLTQIYEICELIIYFNNKIEHILAHPKQKENELWSIYYSESNIIEQPDNCLRTLFTNNKLEYEIAIETHFELNIHGESIPSKQTYSSIWKEITLYEEIIDNKKELITISQNKYPLYKSHVFSILFSIMSNRYTEIDTNVSKEIVCYKTADIEHDLSVWLMELKEIPIIGWIYNKLYRYTWYFKRSLSKALTSQANLSICFGKPTNSRLIKAFSKYEMPLLFIDKDLRTNSVTIYISKQINSNNQLTNSSTKIKVDLPIIRNNLIETYLSSLGLLSDFLIISNNSKNILLAVPYFGVVGATTDEIKSLIQFYVNMVNENIEDFKIDHIIILPSNLPRTEEGIIPEYYLNRLRSTIK